MSELKSLRAEAQKHETMNKNIESQFDSVRREILDLITTIRSNDSDVRLTDNTTLTSSLSEICEMGSAKNRSSASIQDQQLDKIRQDLSRIASYMKCKETAHPEMAALSESLLAIRDRDEFTIESSGYITKLDQIRKDILEMIFRIRKDETGLTLSHRLVPKLKEFEQEHNECAKKLKILKSLYFPELKRRSVNIVTAETSTLSWLYDGSKTSFSRWLASQHGTYWINGLAGSGKSTLMKFAASNPSTHVALKEWAGALPVYVASHYFWHQGHPMQRSAVGLVQSLLYQILRTAPDFIPLIYLDLDYAMFEEWEMETLKSCFDRICRQSSLSAKFCFFIDGLDEYEGDAQELIKILRVMTKSPHIKICASSRPWPEFAEEFGEHHPTLIVQDHTFDDMQIYAKNHLMDHQDFRKMRNSDNSYEEIVQEIAKRAQGVWLWTFLVTNDLRRAISRREGAQMLRTILDSFPPKLEEYFEHIIRRIEPHYRKEMARIFTLVLAAARPLPLYVFGLLEAQDADPYYAVKAVVASIKYKDIEGVIDDWRTRIHSRCSDLLRVMQDPAEEPIFWHRVDFLHRTVADWLRSNFAARMEQIISQTDSDFDANRTLCYMTLMLLKSARATQDQRNIKINQIIGLTDELLYYVDELENSSRKISEDELVRLLDNLDRVNNTYFSSYDNHWTHARDLPQATGADKYVEGGSCNFMALAVQFRLVRYVRRKLEGPQHSKLGLQQNNTSAAEADGGSTDPGEKEPTKRSLVKDGRPLLDYALRPRRVTPLSLPFHMLRETPSVDTQMVRLLLKHGANPNQRVYINDGKTVFALFLISCYEARLRSEPPRTSDLQAWYEATEILLKNGARLDLVKLIKDDTVLTGESMLVAVFGPRHANYLARLAPRGSRIAISYEPFVFWAAALLLIPMVWLYYLMGRSELIDGDYWSDWDII